MNVFGFVFFFLRRVVRRGSEVNIFVFYLFEGVVAVVSAGEDSVRADDATSAKKILLFTCLDVNKTNRWVWILNRVNDYLIFFFIYFEGLYFFFDFFFFEGLFQQILKGTPLRAHSFLFLKQSFLRLNGYICSVIDRYDSFFFCDVFFLINFFFVGCLNKHF